MAEGYSAVMWILFGDEYVTVEAAHFRYSKNTNAAKGIRSSRQYFTLRDVRAQLAAGRALQAEERDISGSNVSFERAAGDIWSTAIFEQTVLDQLVFYAAFFELAKWCIAAMETHEGMF